MKNNIEDIFQTIRNIVLNGDELIIKNSSDLEWVLQSLEHTFVYSESPIEKQFLLALIEEIINKSNSKSLWDNPITFWINEIINLYPNDFENRDKMITLFINAPVDKYRPDIVLSNNIKSIIFEMDGFEYHNTKEQLIKDKIRERDLSKLGYKVYRFSGSEIHQNSKKIATEALSIIYKEFNL